jgi:hypothetical protein
MLRDAGIDEQQVEHRQPHLQLLDRRHVGDVGLGDLGASILQRRAIFGAADSTGDGPAAAGQFTGEAEAEAAGGAEDQGVGHGILLWGKPVTWGAAAAAQTIRRRSVEARCLP